MRTVTLSDSTERWLDACAEYQDEPCPECGRTVEAVDIAGGATNMDPGHEVDTTEGNLLLAHSGDVGDYCEVEHE